MLIRVDNRSTIELTKNLFNHKKNTILTFIFISSKKNKGKKRET